MTDKISDNFNREKTYDNMIDCIEWLIKEGHFNKEYLEAKSTTPICEKPIFQIGDKVQNKQTGYSNIIKHINDKNYMFVDGLYIFDNEDGFAIKEQHEWIKI